MQSFLGKRITPQTPPEELAALGEAGRLMQSKAYRDAGGIFHAATVARVAELMRVGFPEPKDTMAVRASTPAANASQTAVAPSVQQQPAAVSTATPPMPMPKPPHGHIASASSADVDVLLHNPHLRREFEWVYGPADDYGLTQDQLDTLPPRTWNVTTMSKPGRGDVVGPRWFDEEDRQPSGAYALPTPANDKRLPMVGLTPSRNSILGTRLGSGYYPPGVYDPFGIVRTNDTGGPKPHAGLDIVAPVGTPVGAAASGRARLWPLVDKLGNTVTVEHPDGSVTVYSHLGAFSVKDGAIVGAGDQVGEVGTTGNAGKYHPHLHFEVIPADRARQGGRVVLPQGSARRLIQESG